MEKITEFYKRGWAALTQDKGWWKPVLILGLVNCIPIIGQLIVLGYMYDWAKEASWGLERPLTHKVGDLGKRLKYGWFAFVVVLVWALPCALLAGIFSNVPGLGSILYAIFEIGAIVFAVIGCAAAVRAVIYERIMPGLDFKRIWNMAKMDPSGLVRAWAIGLWGVLFVFVVFIIAMIPAAPFMLAVFMMGSNGGSSAAAAAVAGMGVGMILIMIIATIVATIGSTLFELLSTRAYGYWVGQFKPQLWGRANESMPFEREARNAEYAAAAAAAQASATSYNTQVEDDVIDVTPEEPVAAEQTPATTSDNAVVENQGEATVAPGGAQTAAEPVAEQPAAEEPAIVEAEPVTSADEVADAPAEAVETAADEAAVAEQTPATTSEDAVSEVEEVVAQAEETAEGVGEALESAVNEAVDTVAEAAAEVATAAEGAAEEAATAVEDAAGKAAKVFEQKRMGGNADWHTKWQ